MNLIVETTIKRFEFTEDEWGDWYWDEDRLEVIDIQENCILSCAKDIVILAYVTDAEKEYEEDCEDCCDECCFDDCSNPDHPDYQKEVDGYCMCHDYNCDVCIMDESCLSCGNYLSFDGITTPPEDAPEYRCGESLCGSGCICNSGQCKYYFRCQAGPGK